jgi:hypothetical protein
MNQAESYRRAIERNKQRKEERLRRHYQRVRAVREDDRAREGAVTSTDEATRRRQAFYESVFSPAEPESAPSREKGARPGKRARSASKDGRAPSLVDVARAAKARRKQEMKRLEDERKAAAERAVVKQQKRKEHTKAFKARNSRGQPKLGAWSKVLLDRVLEREGEDLAGQYRKVHRAGASLSELPPSDGDDDDEEEEEEEDEDEEEEEEEEEDDDGGVRHRRGHRDEAEPEEEDDEEEEESEDDEEDHVVATRRSEAAPRNVSSQWAFGKAPKRGKR